IGRQVVNAYHVPAVMPRPGIGVFLNRCAGRENLVVSWVDGAVNDDDVDRIVHTVSDGLEWTSGPWPTTSSWSAVAPPAWRPPSRRRSMARGPRWSSATVFSAAWRPRGW